MLVLQIISRSPSRLRLWSCSRKKELHLLAAASSAVDILGLTFRPNNCATFIAISSDRSTASYVFKIQDQVVPLCLLRNHADTLESQSAFYIILMTFLLFFQKSPMIWKKLLHTCFRLVKNLTQYVLLFNLALLLPFVLEILSRNPSSYIVHSDSCPSWDMLPS